MNTNEKKTFEYENLASLIVGAWVLFSPLVGGVIQNYRGAHVYLWNFAIVGFVVIFMSIFAIKNLVAWAERVNIISGVWLMVSPLFLIYFNLSNFYFWSAVLSGALIAILSALALPEADHIIYHKHARNKDDEYDSISVFKPRGRAHPM